MVKAHWKRYIYLWINYAVFEELQANSQENANKVYERIMKMVPHETFTFSKLWIFYAHFFLRTKQVDKLRKLLGRALGICPKPKLFEAYAMLEYKLH
jgi:crooked neck